MPGSEMPQTVLLFQHTCWGKFTHTNLCGTRNENKIDLSYLKIGKSFDAPRCVTDMH
jgi:hypothetical protein